jgi:enamine deaminase RidA (YjgF/YER057c/UK114 family)
MPRENANPHPGANMTKRWAIVGLCVMLGSSMSGQPPQERIAAPKTSPEARLRELKIELPKPAEPIATYIPVVRVGDMLYVSGMGPGDVDGKPLVGRLGADMTTEQGKAAARLVGLQVLAQIKVQAGGSLDNVERIVKTLGMVNATPEFKDHSKVVNGFSDLMVDVFGPTNGKSARSSVGMSSLPNGIPVEIETIFLLKKER